MEQLSSTVQQLNVSQGIISVGLLMSRILGMIFLVPFLGGKLVPTQVKIGIGLSIGVMIYPIVVSSGGLDPIFRPTGVAYPFAMRMIGFLIKEVFIGFVLGFIIHTIWDVAQIVGRFVDTARGSAMGTAIVTQMKSQSSVFGSLYFQLLLVIFLAMNGHLLFIDYFVRSYVLIPVSAIPRFDTGLWPFFEMIMRVTANLYLVSIMMSAPILISIFVTDACMGLFNKVAPQINILFLMMPFKAVLGIFFSMVSLYLFITQGEYLMANALNYVWIAIQKLIPF